MADEKPKDPRDTKTAGSRGLTGADTDRLIPKGVTRADEKPPEQDPGPKSGRGLGKRG